MARVKSKYIYCFVYGRQCDIKSCSGGTCGHGVVQKPLKFSRKADIDLIVKLKQIRLRRSRINNAISLLLESGHLVTKNGKTVDKLNDESPMPFGKHKGMAMANVPADYLLWLHNEGKSGNVLVWNYIKENLDVLKSEASK